MPSSSVTRQSIKAYQEKVKKNKKHSQPFALDRGIEMAANSLTFVRLFGIFHADENRFLSAVPAGRIGNSRQVAVGRDLNLDHEDQWHTAYLFITLSWQESDSRKSESG